MAKRKPVSEQELEEHFMLMQVDVPGWKDCKGCGELIHKSWVKCPDCGLEVNLNKGETK